MLQDIPTPTPVLREARPFVLETERLSLRKPTLADAKGITALANDRRIAEMTKRLPHPYSHDHAVHFIKAIDGGGRNTAFLIESDFKPVGIVGIQWSDDSAPELGYWLGIEFWGRGFATEAARAVIDYAFEEFDIDSMVSGARVVNPASRNVLEKCGFQWTGVELHRAISLGSSTPVDRFRLSRAVWSSLKHWNSAARREG